MCKACVISDLSCLQFINLPIVNFNRFNFAFSLLYQSLATQNCVAPHSWIVFCHDLITIPNVSQSDINAGCHLLTLSTLIYYYFTDTQTRGGNTI